ncbi:MAG: hypothetical protein H6698_01985 [Myxococcales bacterium]|nr:hypothetical protein [Myxococcales bacterium]
MATRRTVAALAALSLAAGFSAPSDAQPIEAGVSAPPIALVLFDTSGSMEWSDSGDDFTYPACISDGDPVVDGGSSRMHAAIEVLTGQVRNQYCTVDTRSSNPNRIDQVDPSRPQGIRNSRLCGASGAVANSATDCVPADPSSGFGGLPQNNDGLIDQFGSQIAFGFMAFDSFPEDGVCASGMFSYGDARSMPASSGTIPDPPLSAEATMACADNPSGFCWNLGARAPYYNEAGAPNCTSGGFVPQGFSVPAVDPTGGISQGAINNVVQQQIVRLLPYWSTPLGAMLDDAYTFLVEPPDYFAYRGDVDGHDVTFGRTDPFEECRKRYVLLITDGVPSFADCVRTGDVPSTDPWDVGCQNYPYASAAYYARRLYEAGIPVYVIGFNIPSATASSLNDIALAGGTDEARFANSGLALVFELGDILSQIAAGTPSRTAPANVSRLSSSPSGVGEFGFFANFSIQDGSPYWTGDVKRVARFCTDGALGSPEEDSFAEWLDDRTLPALDNLPILTSSPGVHSCASAISGDGRASLFVDGENELTASYGVTSAELAAACQAGALPGASATVFDECGDLTDGDVGLPTVYSSGSLDVDRCVTEFDPTLASTFSANFGATDTSEAAMFARWLRGHSLTDLRLNDGHLSDIDRLLPTAQFRWDGARYSNDRTSRLGPIEHSAPTVVTVPDERLQISAGYADFAEATATRPTVLYTATTDGLLRAFNADTRAELFSFLPASVAHRIGATMQSHVALIDGAPVVADVRTFRDAGSERWATVLLLPYRGGGRGVLALDVTDPYEPKYLWELDSELDPQLGLTFSAPDIGSVYLADCFGSGVACERSVAVFGGGAPPSGLVGWETSNIGRTIYVVDIETGRVLRRFTHMRDDTGTFVPISAPVTGDVAAFDTFAGNLMTRAFVGTIDGQLLRIDFTATDPDDWFVDSFFSPEDTLSRTDLGGIFFKPTISLSSENGRAVVVFGTGNLDDLDRVIGEQNYVFSLTESPIFDSDGNLVRIGAEVNWGLELAANERMTARPRIFERRTYFATFIPATDLCEIGGARLYALDYLGESVDRGYIGTIDTTNFYSYLGEDPDQPVSDDNVAVGFHDATSYLTSSAPVIPEKAIIYALQITQRVSCFTETTDAGNRYNGQDSSLQVTDRGEFVLQVGASAYSNSGGAVSAVSQVSEVALPEPSATVIPTSWSVIFE